MRSLLWLSLALISGCSTASTFTEDSSALAARDEAACAAFGAKMDSAVAGVPKNPTYDAVLETVTADCGASLHVAGPSHLTVGRLLRVGSMTKTYVAIVTLGLVAEGRLALDGRLDTALPTAPVAIGGVTLRQLLQHTSGIFNYTDTDEFWASYEQDPMAHHEPQALVDLALAKPPYAAPGAEWHYSNTNYILLGMMLEHVTGTPVAKLIRDRILEPNGLHETFLDGSEPVVGELAPGFDTNGHDIGTSYDLSWAWSAGAMVASPADEAKFVSLVGSGALLPPAMQAELTTGVDTKLQAGFRYGLGVFLLDASITGGQGPAIGHGGDIMGYHSIGVYLPASGMTLFGVVDSDSGAGNDVLAAAIVALLPDPSPRRRLLAKGTLPRLELGM